MTKKKIALLAVGLVSIGSLVACDDPTNSNTGSSDTNTDTSSSSSQTGRRVEVSLANETIPAGTSFFDGCDPTVIYYDNENNPTDYTEWANFTTYKIEDANGNTYGAGDALKAGNHTATITVQSKRTTVAFTVVAGNKVAGSEGNGYKSYYSDDFDPYKVTDHPAMGALGAGKFPALGTPKMLVVPVIFKDMQGNDEYTAEQISVIDKAFFGQREETSWESLVSYYNTSSYGLLNIEGEVTDQYVSTLTTSQAEAKGTEASREIAQAVGKWLKTKGYNPKDYDYNGDGYIDGVNLVYRANRPTTSEDPNASDLWWHYTTYTGDPANVNDPTLYRFFWTKYDAISNNNYVRPDPVIDAHTIIHENGHLMGLNDYYTYDTDEQGAKGEAPAGCADMMDMNVGDHNAYSKMLYNWVREDASSKGLNVRYVDGSNDNFTLELKSFADEGDVVIIRNSTTDKWNETPYDEYLILQYYTPTGVNIGDADGYKQWSQIENCHGGPYAEPGLQVFHVDARIGAQVGTWKTVNGVQTPTVDHWEYTDELLDAPLFKEDGTYVSASQQMTDNTQSRSKEIDGNGKLAGNSENKELAAILSSGVNGFASTSYYNLFGAQTNLFGTTEYAESKDIKYGGDTYSNYKQRAFFKNDLLWNDGTDFNWTFSVESQDDDSCVVHFVNNAAI